jgi:hypothetical protein
MTPRACDRQSDSQAADGVDNDAIEAVPLERDYSAWLKRGDRLAHATKISEAFFADGKRQHHPRRSLEL